MPISFPESYFIRIDGLGGSSQRSGYEDWIEIPSSSFGTSLTAQLSGGGLALGRLEFNDLSVLAQDNTALAFLLDQAARNQRIPAVEIAGLSSTGDKVLDLRLNNVLVDSTNFGAQQLSFDLSFGKVGMRQFESVPGDAPRVVQDYAFDVDTNVPVDFDTLNPVTRTPTQAPAPLPLPEELYVYIEGVPGQVTRDGYEGWHKLLDFSGGVSQDGGRPIFSPVDLVLEDPLALSDALNSMAQGTPVPGVRIVGLAHDGNGNVFEAISLDLKAAMFKAASMSSSGGTSSTSVSIDYREIGITTKTAAENGTPASFGWNAFEGRATAVSAITPDTEAPNGTWVAPTKWFLSIEGATGNSTANGREGWFDVEAVSTSWTEQNGRFEPANLSIAMSGADAELNALLVASQAIGAVHLVGTTPDPGRPGGQQVRTEILLNNAVLTNLSESRSESSPASVSLELAFGKYGEIRHLYNQAGEEAGQRSFGYDYSRGTSTDVDTLDRPPEPDRVQEITFPESYFIRIDGLGGSSQRSGYEDWIEIPSSSFGTSLTAQLSGGGLALGRLEFNDLSVLAQDNTALAFLLDQAARNQRIPAVEIAGLSSTGDKVLDLRLNNVLVDSTNFGAQQLSFDLSFGKVGMRQFESVPGDAPRVVQDYAFDVDTNVPVDFDTLNPVTRTPTQAPAPLPLPEELYVYIEGVPGQVTRDGYEGWHKLLDFSGGVSQDGGRPIFSPVDLVLEDPLALSDALNSMAQGTPVPGVRIVGLAHDGNGNVFEAISLDLKAAMFKAASMSSSGGTSSTSVSIDYREIGITTKTAAENGTPASFGWNAFEGRATAVSAITPDTEAPNGTWVAPTKWFLSIEGATGNSTANGREGWFDVEAVSTSWTEQNGRFEPANLSIAMSGADAELNALLVASQAIGAVHLVGTTPDPGRPGGQQVRTEILLNNAVLTNLSESRSESSPASVSLELAFGKYGEIRHLYNQAGEEAGQRSFGYDYSRGTSTDVDTLDRPDIGRVNIGPIRDVNTTLNVIDENSPDGTLVGLTVQAENAESYRLATNPGGLFDIDPVTGVVTVDTPADFETNGGTQTIVVEANATDASPRQETFTIQVRDIADTLPGGNGTDVFVEGTSGPDTLLGGDGEDTLEGYGGNDDLTGGPSADTLRGGPGDDTYRVEGDDTVVEAADSGTDTIIVTGSTASWRGTNRGPLEANVENLFLRTGFGGDIQDNALNNIIDGGYEETGELMFIFAGAGGDDVLRNATFIFGGPGDDTIIAAENDGEQLDGSGGNDSVTGGSGNEILWGDTGNDTLLGQAGNDTLDGGPGNDVVQGGDGNDTAVIQDNFEVGGALNVDVQFVGLDLQITSLVGVDRISPDVEVLQFLDQTVTFSEVAALLQGPPINGTDASQTLNGTPDSEQINGLGGFDWIIPGRGNDTVDGGPDRDMVSYTDVIEVPGRGTNFMVDLDLGAGIAKLFGGEVDQLISIERATGSIFADVMRGTDGNDELRGIGDYDWFIATEGNDTLNGGNGLDMVTFLEAESSGAPVVQDIFATDGVPPTGAAVGGVLLDLANGSNNTGLADGLTLISVERVTGSSHQDVFFGDGEQNDFRGLGGFDWFVSSTGGRERYFGGDGVDTVTYFNAGAGVTASLRNGAGEFGGQETGFGSAGDAVRDLYFEIENLVGSDFDDRLEGNRERNNLVGRDGDDFLLGYGGIDYLKGGLGNDTLDGGAGSDFALFNGNSGDYTLTRGTGEQSNQVSVVGADGVDQLINVEYFRFDDGDLNIWSL
ncbi:type VI secretion system tube protein Hcp [Tropicibacter sp. R16_0]|uniref:type VI secretion system tube protein Hcp n=1 Tax=Tropicibacter sp. R16_0 TaxID=2821102 RepID=UPI001ADCA633|nr:type VI secretion system tube protein Hcp [Tropicibacter sp. R16_0]MBO9448895.1 type VI secretion system tube protein Hcp [Tropicibacter sp. R16_0]